MQTASSVQRPSSKVFGRVASPSRDSGKRPAAKAPAAACASAAQQVIKLRGARVSETLPRPWGECCRIVEWVNREGQYSCLAVPGDASEDEIRHRMRSHKNGPQHLVTDDRELPARVVLPRA
ncbi:DUF2866 domain-containing protein [Caballeronia sordidicola]|jgi:hypothetical protein|uniref:DUF2866 domain-containing protein n=1 Tax=Caballeronia sordidicola TaxID=196367 RepID=A0A226X611_CABSO|nr:DUF2866 domain-containing protein [Caballeronia sordidicola]OXC78864.1 hypothetical protein BSU04_09425 [Caballeronia sordidicola]